MLCVMQMRLLCCPPMSIYSKDDSGCLLTLCIILWIEITQQVSINMFPPYVQLLTYCSFILYEWYTDSGIYSHTLDDTSDIIWVTKLTKDFNHKANLASCTFKCVDPFVKTFLIKSYCMSLYDCILWSLSPPGIRIIQVALNRILRKSGTYPGNLTQPLFTVLLTLLVSAILWHCMIALCFYIIVSPHLPHLLFAVYFSHMPIYSFTAWIYDDNDYVFEDCIRSLCSQYCQFTHPLEIYHVPYSKSHVSVYVLLLLATCIWTININ